MSLLFNTRGGVSSSAREQERRVVEMGTGPDTVLFLHGLFGTPDHWRAVMERLADRYRVIAPQLPVDPAPGRRRSGIRAIRDLTSMVRDSIEELQVDSLVVCGNSLGGLVAIDLCLQSPQLAKGLVLAGSAGLFERSPVRGLSSRPTRAFVRSTVSGILYDDRLVSEDLIDYWYEAIRDRDYVRFILRVSRATRDRRVEEELGRIEQPTLIIWGRNDEITPPSIGEEFQQLIRGSRLEVIDECGHAPNWERPVEFTRHLEQFLPTCFSRDR